MSAIHKLLLLALASAMLGGAQGGKPLVANKIQRSYMIHADGTMALSKEEFGTYARSAEGTAIHLGVAENGTTRRTESFIQSTKDGLSYAINHTNQTYKTSPWDRSGPSLENVPATGESQIINGVRCFAIPIKDHETQAVIGKSWVSPDLGVVVKSDATLLLRGEPVMRVTEELTNIQTDVTPDLRAFILPTGYKNVGRVVDCPNCRK